MKFLVFSDIHRDWDALRQIVKKKADVYVCLGDLCSWGQGLEKAGEILAPLKEKLWLMPGNNETHNQTQELCQLYGFVDFHKKKIKLDKYFLAGFGYSSPMGLNMPGEVSEEEIKEGLRKFKCLKSLILFTHVPPINTSLDLTHSGVHAGSQAVKEFIEENTPLYSFSGHVHENEGKKEKIGKTTCFLIGKLGLEFSL